MLTGLQRFVNRFAEHPDHPAVHDLIEELRPFAADPAAFQAFVDQWLHGVALPEFQLRAVAMVPGVAGSSWQVRATVENVGSGTVNVVVAVGSTAGKVEGPIEVNLPPHAPRTLEWQVSFEPCRVVVDPEVQVLQLNRQGADCRERKATIGTSPAIANR